MVGPTADGCEPVSGYTVTAQPGGQTAQVSGVARSATVTGLTNDVTHRITVMANCVGTRPSLAVRRTGTIVPAARRRGRKTMAALGCRGAGRASR